MKLPASLVVLFSLLLSCELFSQQEGPNPPGSNENQPYSSCTICTGAIWDSTGNMMFVDGQYSSATMEPDGYCLATACYRSRYIVAYNFGFDVPPNAVIDGITVDVVAIPSANGAIRDCTIVLRRDALNNTYGTNHATSNPWSASQPLHTYGGPTDLWGITWIPDDVNQSDFGVYIKVYNHGSADRTVDVDAIAITINYSIGMNTYSVTSTPQPVDVNHDATNNVLNITSNLPANTSANVVVTDMLGRECIVQAMNTSETATLQLGTAELAPGIYTCSVTYDGVVYTEKFLR